MWLHDYPEPAHFARHRPARRGSLESTEIILRGDIRDRMVTATISCILVDDELSSPAADHPLQNFFSRSERSVRTLAVSMPVNRPVAPI